MSKVAPIYADFSGGEVTPLLYGRAGTDAYNKGLDTCLNLVPLAQGPVERRGGTHFIAETKVSTQKTRLQEFIYSTEINYVLVLGHEFIHFISDRVELGSGAFNNAFALAFNHFSAVELVTTYTEDEIFSLETNRHTEALDTFKIHK